MPNLLDENFYNPTFDSRLSWYNPPDRWEIYKGSLHVFPGEKTDYWQKTHYGFSADNGPFLFLEVEGDFILSTRVRFHPVHQYDQAGLMIRLSPDCWLKTSVEYEPDGPSKLGAVVTNRGYSDWSTQNFLSQENEVVFRISVDGEDVLVETSQDGRNWIQLRLAHLENPEQKPYQAGLYACSPTASGYEAEFDHLKITRRILADATVSLREITSENLFQVIRLSDTLPLNQSRMVATNAVSISEAHYSQYAWYRAIYADEDPVGFVMVYIGPDEESKSDQPVYFLWRLMVAAPYQKLGFGRRTLDQVIRMCQDQGAREFLTSCGEGDGSPEGFYQRLGFERTGTIAGEEIVMKKVL